MANQTNNTVAGGWNSTDDVMEHSGYQTAETIIHRVILPIICACGILGIILTVIVLSRKNMCTSTNCYLIALAIADLLFLVFLSTILADNQLEMHSRPFYLYMIYITFATIFMHMFLMASIWVTVMLAIERYIAICRPFLAAKVCTVTKARCIIISIFLFAIASRLSNFWENKVVTVYDHNTNLSWSYAEATTLSYNHYYQTIYPWLVDGVFASILPFLLLLILNARLIWEVRKSTQYIQRNLMVNAQNHKNIIQREELQITIMLISVIMVFFICQAPYVIYTAMASLSMYQAFSPGFMLFRYITMLLLTLKSAVNFILYCWFSEKFWATLKRIFCIQQCLYMNKGYNSQNGNYYNLRRFSSCATRESTF